MAKQKSILAKIRKKVQRKRKQRAWKKKCRTVFDSTVTNEKQVIFSVFSGRQYSDSPKAIYRAMLSDPRFKDFSFIWSFSRPKDYFSVEDLRDERTRIVKHNSRDFLEALYSSKYWVFNYKTTATYIKRSDQVFLQCWHGTPLKRLGRDIAVEGNAATNLAKIHDSYLNDSKKYDYFISPSRYASDKFVSAFGLDVLDKRDIILETGYPRNDALCKYTNGEIVSLKERMGIPSDKTVILYCPTFRDNQYKAGVGHTYSLGLNLLRLKEELSDRYVVLLRLHYLVSNVIDISQFDGFAYDVSHYDDVNDLYAISDLLITDYSSVFFDYALLRRPILFYMYDLDEYQSQLRDFYLELDELPGPIVTTERELIQTLQAGCDAIDTDKFDCFVSKYGYLDDGEASARVIEEVF